MSGFTVPAPKNTLNHCQKQCVFYLYTDKIEADMIGIKRFIGIIALILSLPLFLMLSSPENLPLPLLIIPFLLVFFIIFTLMRTILRSQTNFDNRKTVIVASTSAVIPLVLLVLQSIGQLTVRDIVIAISFIILIAFYISKADFF